MVRVAHTGAKSFAVDRKVNGKPQRVRLHRYPDMAIEQGREAAAKALSKMTAGIDPIAERRARLGRAASL
ncbi:MAG TPA: Arm DNA-binding domain-containing protein [Gammaproteobacteria bacterium]|nr:Arm DNA-binding domain-containing protein [Gammaproteobacteria bacterium]